jgi:hypothetical protein
MRSALLEVLIPARFMLTIGHMVSVLMIAYTKHENFRAEQEDRLYKAKQEFEVAYAICLVSFVFDIVGILVGTTIFFPKANLLQIVCHFAGGCFISSMIIRSWQYQYFWIPLVLCNVPCALCEIAALIATFALKIVVF